MKRLPHYNLRHFLATLATGVMWVFPAFSSPKPEIVKDIYTGSTSSNPTDLTDVNGTLFFSAENETNGIELWKSDGTEEGTIVVKDLDPGTDDSRPGGLTNVNGTLFFTAEDSYHNGVSSKIWKSDGTEEGTVLIKEVYPTGSSTYANSLIAVNNTLFFKAFDGVEGSELWKTDGTKEGTVLVKDINPTSDFSQLRRFYSYNNTLYFAGNDGFHGEELWKSDGTAEGTIMVKDIVPGEDGSFLSDLFGANGTLFFNAREDLSYEVWKSDGTTEGTVMLKDIHPTDNVFWGSSILFELAGRIFFNANDEIHGEELWVTDGSEEGTRLVKDINSGPSDSDPGAMSSISGNLIFNADDGINGEELWISDGTAEGTFMLKDITVAGSSSPYYLLEVDGIIFFSADDGLHGRELWATDGTEEGTVLVDDLNPGSISSTPADFTLIGNDLFFRAESSDTGRELYILKDAKNFTIAPDISVENTGDELVDQSDTVDFGNVLVQSPSSSMTFTIQNDGNMPLKDVSPSLSGQMSSEFSLITDSMLTILSPGQSTTFSVTHTPSTTGIRTAELRISSNDVDESVFEITLTSLGVTPDITIVDSDGIPLTDSVSTIGFGNTLVNSVSPAEIFTVHNDGDADLTGITPSISGSHSSEFSVNTQSMLPTLAPGQSTSFSVTHTPNARGSRSAELRVSSSDLDESIFMISLSSVGISPEISIESPTGIELISSSSTIDFGNTLVKATSDAKTITIRNNGDANLTGIAPSLSGNQSYEFSLDTRDAQTTLLPGQSTSFSINHTPSATGNRKTTLRVSSNDIDESVFEISLVAVGISPEITVLDEFGNALTDSVSSIAFGNNRVGATSVAKIITIRNDGNAALTGIAPSLFGNQSSEFSLNTDNTLTTLAPGETTSIFIKHAPDAIGNRSTSLRISSSDIDEPGFEITLLSVGIAPEITVFDESGKSLTSGTSSIELGHNLNGLETTPSIIRILNEGQARLTINSINHDGNDKNDFSVDTTSTATALEPNESTLLSVSFHYNIGSLAARTTTLRIESDDLDENPFEITLTSQTPLLLKDINPGKGNSQFETSTKLGNDLLFSAYDTVHGNELWTSDGTNKGTKIIRDIRQGDQSSSPDYLTTVGDTVFFVANDGTSGRELWKSDGTPDGTVVVKDIHNGALSSSPRSLTRVDDTLFFTADDGVNGRELWKSDGTPNGTVLVYDITSDSLGSSPTELTSANNTLFFSAWTESHGEELWKSDGTPEGTIFIKDILKGRVGSLPSNLTNVNGTLYFTASDTIHGIELWKTNGSEAGTALVKDIRPNLESSLPTELTALGNILLFAANDGTSGTELWKSDGTTEGTTLIKDISSGQLNSNPDSLTTIGDSLFFSAATADHGVELWKSDGTTEGTTLVKDINHGPKDSIASPLHPVNEVLFFAANNGELGAELWVSDGTTNGTLIVADLAAGSPSSTPENLTSTDQHLFFTAESESAGREPYTIRNSNHFTGPPDVYLSANSIPENNDPNTTIGLISAKYPRSTNSFYFSLAQGEGDDDNQFFTIDSNSLTLNSSADFEAQSVFSVRLQATDISDPSLSFEKQFSVIVIDIDETPFELWTSLHNLESGVNDAPTDDPNKDGIPNLAHFAFDSDPAGTQYDEGKQSVKVLHKNGNSYLSITLPIHSGAIFSAENNQQKATIKRLAITIQGTVDLSDFTTSKVEEHLPAQSDGLPDLSDGYEYRTFLIPISLDTTPLQFMRAAVEEAK